MKRCEFLYVFKDKISIFEKVWALVCSWLSYIQVRNIQGLTPDLVTLFSEVLEKVWVLVCSCSSCYFIRNIQGPTLFQIWQLSHTFWKGVSPCMFLLCIYKGQKYTRSHTFSEKVWVLVCLTIICPIASYFYNTYFWSELSSSIPHGEYIQPAYANNIKFMVFTLSPIILMYLLILPCKKIFDYKKKVTNSFESIC